MKDSYNNEIGPQRGHIEPERTGAPFAAGFALLAGAAAATQAFAYRFGYHPALGANVEHIYPPWAIGSWAMTWHEKYPLALREASYWGIAVAGSFLLATVFYRVVSSNTSKPNKYLHGSARWASKKDIEKAGLLPRPKTFLQRLMPRHERAADGVYVGAWQERGKKIQYLRHSGPEHVLTYAPTRSGKGVGLVVPTLLSWPHSTVVTDLKGELWALTAGWRKTHGGSKVLRFEPAAEHGSARWNPLDEIRLNSNAVGDVQNLATIIVDPDGKGLDSHWQKTSQALLVGVILHALFKARVEGTTATMAGIDNLLSPPDRPVAELWMEMVSFGHVNGENHPVVGAAARDMLDRPDEEGGSVLSTAKSYLSLYRDPVVAANTSACDFRIKDLMHHDSPVSLYLVTQPNDKARLRPLVRVFLNMMFRLLADKMDFENGRPKAHYNHRLLWMADEFPALGRLPIIEESLAFVAGYGIKCYLICQDINQLRSKEAGYGPDETITSNCHVQNAYPPNRVETAKHLSELTGTTTILKEQITTSGKRSGSMHSQVSRTTQETARPLLTPDEALRMQGPTKSYENGQDVIKKGGDMVVYVAGFPAIFGTQPLYFLDPTFKARAAVPAPANSDRLYSAVTAAPVEL